VISLIQMLRNALASLNSEKFPTGPEAQESFFQEQVAMGEGLATQGPDAYVPSALSFYRALKVYPNPVELIMSRLTSFQADVSLPEGRPRSHLRPPA
jgi:hypothetical protein